MICPATHARRHPPTWLLHGGGPATRWLIRRRYDVREHGTPHVQPQGPVAPVVPMMMYGTRPAGGGKDALPDPVGVVDLVHGAPFRVRRRAWPRTRRLVTDISAALHARMLEDLAAGLALTGQTVPGPIPADEAKDIS